MSAPLISVVIPIYNEEEIIEKLFETTVAALRKITESFEIICVDDGSTDRSIDMMVACHHREPRFKVLVLSRNFGHQAAYTAGLSYAKGEYIVMMDGDLQDPPELIAEMYRKLTSEQLDVVSGKRIERNEPWLKRAQINLFHKIFKRVSNLGGADNVGNFSMFTRKVLHALLSLKEKNRYLPGLRLFLGFKQGHVEYSRPDRGVGKPKMNFKKLFYLSMDALFSFSDLPIKVCLFAGMFGVITFFLGLGYSLISKITGIAPFGWSSIFLSVYFFGSVQLLFLGILGEYIFRIYRETQNRPPFIVDRFIG